MQRLKRPSFGTGFRVIGQALTLAMALALTAHSANGAAAVAPTYPLLILGDSIGEGVQTADASIFTQPNSYANRVAAQFTLPFPLPWILSNPLGSTGQTNNRGRIFPNLASANLAVSGATVASLLDDAADANTTAEINSETDLVLFPRLGSQMEIAEKAVSGLIFCWIGNNDVLSAVTSFDQLDASQMTSVADFKNRFGELAQRLKQVGAPVVFANIPNVADIGFLLDRDDLIRFTGSDQALPQSHLTSMVALLLIRSGLADQTLLQDPNYVLDPAEIQAIEQRIDAFNQIIAQQAATINMPVVDINGRFQAMAANPTVIKGVPLSPRFLGGLFSLDGVHPSNIGHALIANAFLETINLTWGTSLPLIDDAALGNILLSDPFVDKDADTVVTGRPFTSLLETLDFLLGISGDSDDGNPAIGTSITATPALGSIAVSPFTRRELEATLRNLFSR